MRGTSWLLVALVVIMGSALGVFGGFALAKWQFLTDHGINPFQAMQPAFKGERYVRILMMGEDNTGRGRKAGHGLSDTLVVMALDTQTREVRAISIPRDTQVEIPGHGTCKINSANAYGGPEMAQQVIEGILGVKINYRIATTTQGLRGLVDMLGGVYIVIDENMHYTDRRGHLYIRLEASPEKQLLNGDQAEQYVRFRHDAYGDSGYRMVDGKKVPAGRIVRQQKFMRALANRVIGLPNSEARVLFLTKAQENGFIESTLQANDWKGLMDILKDFNPEKMNMAVLPGAPGMQHGASYWIPDTAKIPALVSQNLLFQGAATQELSMPRVEVLNGSRIAGAAKKVADQLKTAGIEVERTANAPSSSYTECCIITRRGKTSQVDVIAGLLNCRDIQEEAAAPDKPDITIIVGSNYRAQL